MDAELTKQRYVNILDLIFSIAVFFSMNAEGFLPSESADIFSSNKSFY